MLELGPCVLAGCLVFWFLRHVCLWLRGFAASRLANRFLRAFRPRAPPSAAALPKDLQRSLRLGLAGSSQAGEAGGEQRGGAGRAASFRCPCWGESDLGLPYPPRKTEVPPGNKCAILLLLPHTHMLQPHCVAESLPCSPRRVRPKNAQASRMYLSCKGPAQETLHLHLRAALFCSLARKLALPFEGGDARAKKKPCIVFTISFFTCLFPACPPLL